MARRRRKSLSGPARAYRKSPQRYEDVRHLPSTGGIAIATKLGCRDAVKGRKNAHKPEARGFVAAYREGYRICDKIWRTGHALTPEENRVSQKLHLESEVQFSPLGKPRMRRR